MACLELWLSLRGTRIIRRRSFPVRPEGIVIRRAFLAAILTERLRGLRQAAPARRTLITGR
jgi:hypothetical protein